MFKYNLSPQDAGFHAVQTFQEVTSADVTRTPGVFMPRKLSGDFNALANKIAEKLIPEGETFAALSHKELKNWLKQEKNNLAEQEKQAGSYITQDLELLETAGYTLTTPEGEQTHPKLHVFKPLSAVAECFHTDACNRVLCAYNGPTTQGLVHKVSRMEKLLGRAITWTNAKLVNCGIPLEIPAPFDPLRFKDRFSFDAGTLWKHSGSLPELKNENPFWHRGRRAQAGQARLLLFANENDSPASNI